jgi:hypothetical protein
MAAIAVPNRPFSSERKTGLMLPDGIFEVSLGRQRINAQFKNIGGAPEADVSVFIETVSDPGITVTPQTHTIPILAQDAVRTLSWEANFSGAPPGIHFVSFIAENASGRSRIIKKIFVTRTQFNVATTTATVETPEGVMAVSFRNMLGPRDTGCPTPPQPPDPVFFDIPTIFAEFGGRDPAFSLCLSTYLPTDVEAVVTPTPPYAGQYGDLPFQDPWWKVALCVVAVVLLIAAAIEESQNGSGSVVITTGGPPPPDDPDNCCGVRAEGGGTSEVAAGLVAAAAAAVALAVYTDIRDPYRRGQDHTAPAAGELTISEQLSAVTIYSDPVALGQPFSVSTRWTYTRNTTGANYSHSVSETNRNTHVLSSYVINAPDVVHLEEEQFVICASFRHDRHLFRGDDLFVQCFLIGPQGERFDITLQDDGIVPDKKPNDGVYCGVFDFVQAEAPIGRWTYFVIAQDVNKAQPDMSPDEAAQLIGGVVLTHQLTISFDSEVCPFAPDGQVQVI